MHCFAFWHFFVFLRRRACAVVGLVAWVIALLAAAQRQGRRTRADAGGGGGGVPIRGSHGAGLVSAARGGVPKGFVGPKGYVFQFVRVLPRF